MFDQSISIIAILQTHKYSYRNPTFISPSAIAGAALVHYLDEVKKCITIRMEINSH